ncbi:tol-pal system protein YbgF [Rubrivivax sp. RP6-9]|uniref:tol-pal system protein YbgF n=1 Tax=Rubrivivax sp. RP6-9 TaxID=3415750 RepID=UPI003CC66807
MAGRIVAPVLLAIGLLGGGAAHAGLFDDEEARKAIVDLRQSLAKVEEQNAQRAAESAAANAALLEQITALRRSLLDLNNQLETMRADIAKLRGSDEQLARDVAELQRRQGDVSQTLDERLRRLEPVKVSLDGREVLVDPEQKRQYDEAIATLRGGDFDKSVAALGAFQRRFPGSPYADSVRFWLGNALYGKRDYKEAITAFRGFVSASPDHPRAPEALLALANSQAEMKDPRGARKTIEDLLKAYPQSEAAQAGKERLASLK